MVSFADTVEIKPKVATSTYSGEHVSSGVPIPKPLRVAAFHPDEWESFIEEWASSLKSEYFKVRRFGGAGDSGVDVAAFVVDETFEGGWDNYQCKRYDHALRPSDIWIEIGKVIYYSHIGEYPPPRKHFFVASQGIGTTLEKLLAKPEKLKAEARAAWVKHCETEITSKVQLPLTGALLAYFDLFDFGIFSSRSVVTMIEQHAKTPFHAVRFGGGLPPRPLTPPPPKDTSPDESRYITQLFEAYGEHLGEQVTGQDQLAAYPPLKEDFLRQRTRFYHAESLRNFARDTVPPGTFESLEEEVFLGVIDVVEGAYSDGLARMRATIVHAGALSPGSSPLAHVLLVPDQQGICHRLANDDRLTWVKTKGAI